jgi:hypothetical protein
MVAAWAVVANGSALKIAAIVSTWALLIDLNVNSSRGSAQQAMRQPSDVHAI